MSGFLFYRNISCNLAYNVSVQADLITPKDKTDEELVALTLENKDTFAEIISRYELKLGNFIKRRTRASEEDVEDLLQNIFIKVYLNLNAFNPSLKFSSWIYRIAYNEVVSEYRKNKIREHYNFEDLELSGDISVQDFFGDDTNILQTVHFQVEAAKLKKLIEGLDSKYKEVIALRFLEEKEYEEISDILQIPVGTVSTLIYRARKELLKNYANIQK